MQSSKRVRQRKSSISTFGPLTPELQRLYDFDNFDQYIGSNQSQKQNQPIYGIKKKQRKFTNQEMLSTIHETSANRSNKLNRKYRTLKSSKTQRNFKQKQKPNYEQTFSSFLECFKKSERQDSDTSYDADKFFTPRMLNKLQLRNLSNGLKSRCKANPKQKYEEYRMKNQNEVGIYYENLDRGMKKRSSYSEIKYRTKKNVKKFDQQKDLPTHDFQMFEKTQQGIIENISKIGIEPTKQQRMINRFYETHIMVKGKMSEPTNKVKLSNK